MGKSQYTDRGITAQLLLREVANATVGFPALAKATGSPEKSLMRMLSAMGNPQARNLFRIVHELKKVNGIGLEVRAVSGKRAGSS